MFKTIITLFRGATHDAEEAFSDRHALAILNQQMRDSAVAVEQARKADLALLSVGSLTPDATMLRLGILSPEDQAFIKDLDQRLHPAPSPATATGAAKP